MRVLPPARAIIAAAPLARKERRGDDRAARGFAILDFRFPQGGGPAGVAYVRLANDADVRELQDALAAIREEPAVRVVLLDATGFRGRRAVQAGELLEHYLLPIVFVFCGRLARGLFPAAVAADVRVADAGAVVAAPGAMDAWTRKRTALVLGEGVALRLLLSGGAFEAGAALNSGFVSAVAPAGEALAEGTRIAAVIASRGPIATQLAKEAIWRGLEMPLAQALRFETDLTLLLQTTKDRAEGVRAFLEKRPPQFTGE